MRIGKDTVFKVEFNHSFTSQRIGILKIAIGIHPERENRTYAGEYKVKIRVKR